jgi:hypothetical protein
MSQRSNDPNPFDPFAVWQTMRDANMEAWAKTMGEFVNSEAYTQATARTLDAYLTASAPFRRAIETTMAQVLTQFNMPTRTDVTSLAERLTHIEMRLDDLDAKIHAMEQAVQQASSTSISNQPAAAAKED